mmetsp:Transcript_116256/g.201827  ORF Transcript_116256/g.201827 Transcript_116256/m.201827 type:complete len:242 (+) Transcript_116256:461-1186(+)
MPMVSEGALCRRTCKHHICKKERENDLRERNLVPVEAHIWHPLCRRCVSKNANESSHNACKKLSKYVPKTVHDRQLLAAREDNRQRHRWVEVGTRDIAQRVRHCHHRRTCRPSRHGVPHQYVETKSENNHKRSVRLRKDTCPLRRYVLCHVRFPLRLAEASHLMLLGADIAKEKCTNARANNLKHCVLEEFPSAGHDVICPYHLNTQRHHWIEYSTGYLPRSIASSNHNKANRKCIKLVWI